MSLFASLLLVLSSLACSSKAQSCLSVRSGQESCVSIAGTTCSRFYPESAFPNDVTSSLDMANSSLAEYQRLLMDASPSLQSNCSVYAEAYLCLALMPPCDGSVSLFPCEDVCRLITQSCSQQVITEFMDSDCLLSRCERFPSVGAGCIGVNSQRLTGFLSLPPPATSTAAPGGNATSPTTPPTCPLPNNTFFSESSKSFAIGWVSFWSVLCFISTTLTILTFVLDTSRFEYPWRPVIYLALAFNVHSSAYFLSLALGRKLVTCPDNTFVRSGSSWGWAHAPCILVFIFLYYTMMAVFIWWVILTVCWFLVSALQWSHEAVGKWSPLFQCVAWILPLLMTISLLAARAVGADELTATCFVVSDGSTSSFLALLLGVVVPLVLFLVTGVLFLLLGFVGIMRIRSYMRRGGKQQEQQSLEKLMIRIGIFVTVYIVPASVLIGCFVYELASRPRWQPLSNSCSNCSRPNSAIFMVRIFMFLLIGVLTGVWIWSRKTLKSWQQCPRKCGSCCRDLQQEDRERTPGEPVSAENALSGKNAAMMMPSTNYSYPDSGLDSF